MAIKLGFGILDEKPSTGESELLPAGWYSGYVTSLEVVDTKNKNGKILKAALGVMSGYYKGIGVTENFNIINQNEMAQRIARSELSALGVAAGVPNNDDAEILLRKPLKFKVKIESFVNKDGETKFVNRICGYRGMSEQIETIETKTDIEYPVTIESSSAPVSQPQTPAWNVPPSAPVAEMPKAWQQAPAEVTPPPILDGAPTQPWQQPTVEQPAPAGFDPNKKPAWMTAG